LKRILEIDKNQGIIYFNPLEAEQAIEIKGSKLKKK